MDVIIRENERIDDLERNGYRIIQNRKRFCFGMDAVLLSGFIYEGESGAARSNHPEDTESAPELLRQLSRLRIADLGTGTGIIPILLHGKLGYGTAEKEAGLKHLVGIEIQEEMAEMAERSVLLNDLNEEIDIICADLKQASSLLGRGCFDVVSSNPPYMKSGGGVTNPDSSKAISRHEVLCSFEDVAREASLLLKSGGRFYLVHRPERLAELLETLRRFHLEPKRIRMVHSFAEEKASMVLIEARRGEKPFLKVDPPLIIYSGKGEYTEEIRRIYYF